MKFGKTSGYVLLAVVLAIATSCNGKRETESGKAFLYNMQDRDSVLIADQLGYGFSISGLHSGESLGLPEEDSVLCEGVELVSGWKLDTLARYGKKDNVMYDVRGYVTLTSFDEGEYSLRPLRVMRISDRGADTLSFDPLQFKVLSMPVDTAEFTINDIKPQVEYPVTFREVFPYLAAVILLAAIAVLALFLYRRYTSDKRVKAENREPAHIVALRKLDGLRGEKLWTGENQKIFYSGVTDALREYMDSRYGIPAMEMTTNEIFNALKKEKIQENLVRDIEEVFESADYVKFAKHLVEREEIVTALPRAVAFVSGTYQTELESDAAGVKSE